MFPAKHIMSPSSRTNQTKVFLRNHYGLCQHAFAQPSRSHKHFLLCRVVCRNPMHNGDGSLSKPTLYLQQHSLNQRNEIITGTKREARLRFNITFYVALLLYFKVLERYKFCSLLIILSC